MTLSLVGKEHSWLNASELTLLNQMLNEKYEFLMEDTQCLHRFLCQATFHNDTELVKRLLTNPLCYVKDSENILRSLFIAISRGHTALVEILLSAGSDLNLLEGNFFISPSESAVTGHEKFVFDLIRCNSVKRESSYKFSAVECACICDERDILKLLVAYDTDQKRRSLDECGTPLHVVINLLNKDYFRQMLTLPAIVQVILDTKVDVNALDGNRYTSFDVLIETVRCIVWNVDVMITEESRMIIETARILLTAGAVATNLKEHYPESLVSYYRHVNRYWFIECFLHVQSITSLVIKKNGYALVTGLTKLMLKHGTLHTCASKKTLFDRILVGTVDCVKRLRQATDADSTQATQIVVDNISDILKYILLLDADFLNDIILFDTPVTVFHSYSLEFVFISGCSSEDVHLHKLMRLMLNGLSASQVNELQMLLMERSTGQILPDQRVPSNQWPLLNHWNPLYLWIPPNPSVENTRKALEWISAVVVPFSLQHLSHRAVRRAMSGRCLDARNVSTLGLSKNVADDILLLND